MRLGIGGGAFGVRGGISTRGLGVGVGPFSAGTSWRGGGGGGFLSWLILGGIFLLIVGWPYLLGTYIAVQCGAWNPSTSRFVVGWFFEVIYIAALVAWFVIGRATSAQRSARNAHRHAVLQASGAVYETKSGNTVIYRHGTCTTNHRSADTAARCTKSAHEPLSAPLMAEYLPDPTSTHSQAVRTAIRWGAGILAVGTVIGISILVADPIHSAAGNARDKPCPTQAYSSATSAHVTMPDLVEQNAGGVEARLKSMGLTNIELSSANPTYKSVWVASNWTVVSTDPAPGCVVNTSQHVTIYVTK